MDINPIILLILIIIGIIMVAVIHWHLMKMMKQSFSTAKPIQKKDEISELREEITNIKERLEKLEKKS